jgi:hypothetical protein
MSLRSKLVSLFMLFALVPTLILGGYQAWVSWSSKVADAQASLTSSVKGRRSAVQRYFRRASLDIEAMAQAKEVGMLLQGVEERDEDRVASMTKRLASSYAKEAALRENFRTIAVSLPDGKCLLRLEWDAEAGEAVRVDKPAAPPGAVDAGGGADRTVVWEEDGGAPRLWIHRPLGEGGGALSVRLALDEVYETCADPGVALLRPDGAGALVVDGRPATGAQDAGRLPDIAGAAGAGMTGDYAWAGAAFPAVAWAEGQDYRLYEMIPRSRIMAPIRDSLLVTGGFVVFIAVLAWALGRVYGGRVSGPLEEVTACLTTNAHRVHSSSEGLTRTSGQLADASSAQAASLQQTSATMEQLSAMARTNAEHSAEANQRMGAARTVVDASDERVRQMSAAMDEIRDSSASINHTVKVIEEIAFQTNLLALNAAVEAARAGDAGKGFAVVAEEVRNLAQRSAKAAQESAPLIERTVRHVSAGTEILDGLVSCFGEISAATVQVSDVVDMITRDSEEQAKGIEQVNEALTLMDTMTQRNAADADASAQSARELSGQADELEGAVGRITAVIGRT